MTKRKHWNQNQTDISALGYIIGALHGDGNVTGYPSHVARLSVTDREFADEFMQMVTQIGLDYRFHVYTYNDKRLPLNEVKVFCAAFTNWYLNGEYRQLYSNPDFQHGYVRGFFDAEGSAQYLVTTNKKYGYYQHWHAHFSNTDKSKLEDVKRFLKNVGLHPTLHEVTSNYLRTAYFNGKPITSKKMPYVLQLARKDEVRRFLSEFQPSIPSKQLVFLEHKAALLPSTKKSWHSKITIPNNHTLLEVYNAFYLEKNQNFKELGLRFGVSYETIARWLGFRSSNRRISHSQYGRVNVLSNQHAWVRDGQLVKVRGNW